MAPSPPRYAPALPLPRRPYRPGLGLPRPHLPLAPLPGEVRRAWHSPTALPPESRAYLCYGIDLYNAGCWWEAHEAWECLWRRTVRRTGLFHLLQGLILLAAAALKGAGARPAAGRRLERRAGEHLAAARRLLPETRPLGVELGALLNELDARAQAARSAAAQILSAIAAAPPPMLWWVEPAPGSDARD